MSTLLVSDLLKVFDNYEPSRTRVWEIVRTIHPVHCAALLYLLENVSKSRKITTLKLPTSEDDANAVGLLGSDSDSNSAPTPDRVYKTAVTPTLNLTRVTVTRQLRPCLLYTSFHRNSIVEVHDAIPQVDNVFVSHKHGTRRLEHDAVADAI